MNTMDWEPRGIAEMIRRAIGGRRQKEAAGMLGITPQYLCDIVHARRGLSPEVAARLHRIGLNGRKLYLRQERRRVEIAYRQEIGEVAASREAIPKSKRTNKLSATAYRKRSTKAWCTRKKMAALRAAEAAAKADGQDVGREAA